MFASTLFFRSMRFIFLKSLGLSQTHSLSLFLQDDPRRGGGHHRGIPVSLYRNFANEGTHSPKILRSAYSQQPRTTLGAVRVLNRD